jgi:signal peptidase II
VRAIYFYIIALVIVVCDQVSKHAIMASIPLGDSVPVISGWLYLTHIHNTGGAFSLFHAQNSVFIVIALAAVCALIYAYHVYQRDNTLVSAALALALGGAIGNLLDRIQHHYVIDFFDIRVWPIFNIADTAITIGIILLVLHYLIPHKQPVLKAEDTPLLRKE